MKKLNKNRTGCKDVFNAFLVENATYSGYYEIPSIKAESARPKSLTIFSKALSGKNKNSWIHFYEDDFQFERVWRNPLHYLELFRSYDGVILPDFSLYRDMPLSMQIWNIYRSRAIGSWLQNEGVPVIPNIRYGDERTYQVSCDGIEKNCVIAVGSHGTMKNNADRHYFVEGLCVVVNKIKPKAIIVYGTAPETVFGKFQKIGIEIIQFNSDYFTSHREVK